MAFALRWTELAAEQFRELQLAAERASKKPGKRKPKQIGLFKQVNGCIAKLAQNPRHPGLQTHPYSSLEHPFTKGEKVFEAYAQNKTPGAYRVFWCYGPDHNELTIIAITPHP